MDRFCCPGCAAAHALITAQGLDRYYVSRSLDPTVPPPRPDPDGDDDDGFDWSDLIVPAAGGEARLYLMVEGVQCGACVWLIESLLARQTGVSWARVNLTTRRLEVRFHPGQTRPDRLVAPIRAVGYRVRPYDPDRLDSADRRAARTLTRAMAVTGFAAGNVMLLSVAVWAGAAQGMGPATRDLMHWLSALVALPAVAYGVRPFAASAWRGLRTGHATMDLPITIGVALTCAMSLWETARGGPHAYFDSAVTLLFFLLVGRVLDARARGTARRLAEQMLSLEARAVLVIGADGTRRRVRPGRVAAGATVLVAAGERIGVDGTVIGGRSDIDRSWLCGESVPAQAEPGCRLLAGTLNLTAPLRLRAEAVGADTVLAGMVRLIESAEQGRTRHVALAERVSRAYTPVVHLAALATFLGWVGLGGMAWQPALLIAVSVLIITCPCALALAVPVVQVIASSRLMRQGILIKSPTALERLALADHVVFDKTGTLTRGQPILRRPGQWSDDALCRAAAIAANSRHPLARSLAAACPGATAADGIHEYPGQGLAADDGTRLGSAAFVGLAPPDGDGDPELWLAEPDRPPVRFAFADPPRDDAAATIARLRQRGLGIELLSGDRPAAVAMVARMVGLVDWRARCDPAAKVARLHDLALAGRRPMMVGDGLNDAAALAAAFVSISPSGAADICRAAADVVFQGDRLDAVERAIVVAVAAGRLVRQNFAMATGYNLLAIPLAAGGQVSPLVAAIAMSASSLLVIVNALRLSGGKR